ncbi:hypothetical protein BGZ76_008971 [Entomortierella beljakovae]|nr:hypothetical protein BGZ76_008971 [Entomortierella beljakovae]
MNPLDITEIRLYVGYYLECKDLFSCLLVCAAWSDTFIPLLYTKLSICDRRTRPPLDSLKKYIDIPRRLHFFGDAGLRYYSIEFSSLTVLSLDNDSHGVEITPAYVKLIQKNSETLREFNIARHPVVSTTTIWEALLQCPKLNTLNICQYSIHNVDLELFWRVCTKVEKLTLLSVEFVSDDTPTSSLPQEFPKLTSLALLKPTRFSWQDQLQLITKSKNLTKLRWNPESSRGHMDVQDYLAMISSDALRNVRELEMVNIFIDDETTAITLKALEKVTSIDMSHIKFAESSYLGLLENQAATIRSLNLFNCETATSPIIQGILSSCPSLEEFMANAIQGSELVQIESGLSDMEAMVPEKLTLGKDWVCRKLRSLTLFFDMNSCDPDDTCHTTESDERREYREQLEQFHAFRQLSRLTELESLSVSRSPGYDGESQGLKLKVEEMSVLASLKRLKTFSFNNTDQDMSEDEIDWISENWPSLKLISGTFTLDSNRNQSMKNYMTVLTSVSNLRIYA